ncbi:integral membrane protein [Colletotrichum tamarilloi]|uniref:Integral membrane protein n=1 Tax=Colletotrichum tamarilloi TaxID=1209934 RepID=A0ABQ9RHB9_9PEZI|nr:uncharacterized protein CTAM01_04824 [Colletotrichum tamarilloi]KAK1503512.1 integral membrane protein [Colletotrichum tamarilloi]
MSTNTGSIGAAPPPPGETPNFDNPRDAGHMLHMVYMILIQIVVVVFFALRVYVKLSVNGKFRLEDWSCLVGWIFTVLLNSTVLIKLHFGEGFHIWEITAGNFTELQKWLYISSLLYSPAAFFTKTALLLLTVRVFSVDRNVARTLHALLAFFLLCYIPAQVAKTLVCIPVQAFWDTNVVNFKCIDQTKLFLYDGSISIVSDLVILVVPIPLTWALRVSLARKVKVVALLGAGGVAFAVTVYRVYLTIKFADTKDPTVDFIPLDWTVTGELAIGIVCACFPSINHLLERRSATRVSSNSSTAGLSWWRKASKDCLDSLSSWGMNRRSRLAAGNRIGLQNTTADSNARLASTPGSTPGTERDEPQQSDYDIELAVISMPRSEPHPGELVTTRASNRNDGLLNPLPVIRRSSPFKIEGPS